MLGWHSGVSEVRNLSGMCVLERRSLRRNNVVHWCLASTEPFGLGVIVKVNLQSKVGWGNMASKARSEFGRARKKCSGQSEWSSDQPGKHMAVITPQ